MYNEEQKLKFLETIESESSRKYIVGMFNRFEKHETASDKDFATWSADEIYSMICDLYILDFGTIKQYLSSLTNYRDYIGANLEQLNAQDIDLTPAIQQALVPSTAVLKNEMNKILDPSQGNYMRAAICFAWLGIDAHVMPLIKSTSIDFEAHIIHDSECGLHIIDVDDNIIQALKEYSEVKEAIRGNGRAYPLYNGRVIRLMAGANSSKVPEVIKVASIYTEFSTLKKKYEDKFHRQTPLEYANVLRSGGLSRLYQLEKDGIDIFDGKNDELLQSTYAAPGKLFDIRSLYRQYKRAFNLK